MSQIEFYHNLYVSECWQKKKGKIVKRLKENKLQPQVYVITLSQGEQNQLEFFSSVLLKQSIFEHSKLFVIGIADGYDEALFLVEEIVQDVYQETKSANARQFLLTDQAEYDRKGRYANVTYHTPYLKNTWIFDTCFSRTYVSCSYNSSFCSGGISIRFNCRRIREKYFGKAAFLLDKTVYFGRNLL